MFATFFLELLGLFTAISTIPIGWRQVAKPALQDILLGVFCLVCGLGGIALFLITLYGLIK